MLCHTSQIFILSFVSSVDFDSLHIFGIVCLVFCLLLFTTMGTSLRSLANEALNETTENFLLLALCALPL